METQERIIKVPKIKVGTNLNYTLWVTAKESGVTFNRALEIGVYSELLSKNVIDITELPENYDFFTKEIARLKKEKIELITQLNEFKDYNENGK